MKGDTQSVLCEEQEEHSRTEFGLFFRLLGVLWFRFQVREKMSWREELIVDGHARLSKFYMAQHPQQCVQEGRP